MILASQATGRAEFRAIGSKCVLCEVVMPLVRFLVQLMSRVHNIRTFIVARFVFRVHRKVLRFCYVWELWWYMAQWHLWQCSSNER